MKLCDENASLHFVRESVDSRLIDLFVYTDGAKTTDEHIRLFQVDNVGQLSSTQFSPDRIVADSQDLCSIESRSLWIDDLNKRKENEEKSLEFIEKLYALRLFQDFLAITEYISLENMK